MARRVELDQEATMERAVLEVVGDDPDDGAGNRDADAVVISPGIVKPAAIGEASRFFNPTNPGERPRILLDRTFDQGREKFRLVHPIGYWDAEVGAVIVPDNLARFDTDLTSVTRFFTWLVATTGVHLPAALVHDGLIPSKRSPTSYVAGREIDRETADRIFRSGMRDLGTSWLLRWLIWAGVATGTMWSAPLRQSWWRRVAIVLTVAVVAVLGTLATIELFDCREVLPWMGDRPVWLEVLWGALFAVAIPVVLSVLWGRQWRAGIFIGVALALMLHVTVALVLVYSVIAALDAAFGGRLARALRWGGVAIVITAVVVLIGIWAC